MTDPIKALIAAVDNLLRSGPSEVSDARRKLGFAVAAAKAAAEGRPEPAPTAPNLDALAKLAPFQHHRDGSNSWIIGGASDDDAEAVPMRSIAAALNEWAELRAYRERTEAALAKLCRTMTDQGEKPGGVMARVVELAQNTIKANGLWRDPGQGATNGN